MGSAGNFYLGRLKLKTQMVFLFLGIFLAVVESDEPEDEKKGNYYTSLVGVQALAKKEQEIVQRLVRQRKKLMERIDHINFYLDDYSDSILPLIRQTEAFRAQFGNKKYPVFKNDHDLEMISELISSNPIMVFKLLRRYNKELPKLAINVMKDITSGFATYIDSIPDDIGLPNESDLVGAADGLLRLQETYSLPTHDLSNGRLIDKRTGNTLQASDMQFIGVRAFNINLNALSVQWLYGSRQKVLQGDSSISLEIITDHLRTAVIQHNKELLRFSMEEASNLFSNLINSNMSNIPGLYIPPLITEYETGILADTVYDYFNFNALCRGETLLSSKKSKNLRCWYSFDSPQNVISPLKFELHHENPPIFQVYDLISDKTINHIKTHAQPHLKRAQVFGPVGSKGGTQSDVRTSSVAWLQDRNKNDELILNIPRMVQRATGLNVWANDSVEDLQISCYGSVGGHYIPHLDAFVDDKVNAVPFDTIRGDRVATVMFYLTDVELGGGTAFPRLGVASKPVKGSAVIWYNLRKNGDKEFLMLHGGCPVLYGNKWGMFSEQPVYKKICK